MNDNNSSNTHLSEEQIITSDMLKIFYSRPIPLTDENGNPFPVPAEGSLGLLALGHIGLIEWRKVKIAFTKENNAGE